MSYNYKIYKKIKLVASVARGVITERELLKHEKILASDAEFEPVFSQFMDFRDVTDLSISERGLKELTRFSPWHKDSRRAVIMARGLAYDLALMAASDNSLFGSNFGVFYEIDDAIAWLEKFSFDDDAVA